MCRDRRYGRGKLPIPNRIAQDRNVGDSGRYYGGSEGKERKDDGFGEEEERMLRTSATGMNDMEKNNREASRKMDA